MEILHISQADIGEPVLQITGTIINNFLSCVYDYYFVFSVVVI